LTLDLSDLMPFCEHQNPKLPDRPFSQDGFTWATDGKVIVRVPLMPDVAESDKPKLKPTITATMSKFHRGPFYVATLERDLPEPTMHECPHCEEWSEVEPRLFIDTGSCVLWCGLWRLISSLPGLRIGRADTSESPLPFEFDDGGAGLVMPMTFKSAKGDRPLACNTIHARLRIKAESA